MKVFFISGIDTDIGKTVLTASMAKFLLDKKRAVTTFKLAQTGSPDGRSMDVDAHRKLAQMPLSGCDKKKLTFPIVYTYPASPHRAAKLDDRPLDFAKLEDAYRKVCDRFEYVLVEGAGGLMVPLTETLLTIDYAARMKWPLVLLCGGRLGSINHTLLSLEAAKTRGMRIAAVVYNLFPATDPIIEAETRLYLQNFLQRHYPGTLYYELPEISGEVITSTPDYSQLFGVQP